MIRRIKPSKSGTVKAVSPCTGLNTTPFEINLLHTGATAEGILPNISAISPERWGPLQVRPWHACNVFQPGSTGRNGHGRNWRRALRVQLLLPEPRQSSRLTFAMLYLYAICLSYSPVMRADWHYVARPIR